MGFGDSDFKFYSYVSADCTDSSTSSLDVLQDGTWTYIGPLLDCSSLPPVFTSFAAKTIKGNLQAQLLPLLAFINGHLIKNEMSHYWLTIRVSKPHDDFDIPRWHTDTNVMVASEPVQKHAVGWKLAATLQGPGTLFQANNRQAQARMKKVRKAMQLEEFSDHVCASFPCRGCSDFNESVRQRLAVEMQSSRVVRPDTGDCCWFKTGEGAGAVHSEPRCDVDRVFVNATPGTEEQIRALANHWGMEMPRTWTYGTTELHEIDG